MRRNSDRVDACGRDFSAPASAQVKPGDFITPDNAYKVKDLVSPGQYLRVMHGMTIKVTPTERIDWPPPYKDATEKYSSQVRLTPDHRSLIGYVAGEPFPIVDANDPDAGTKVMWNVAFRPISSDEYDLRWFDCDSVYWGKNAPFREITDIEVGPLCRLQRSRAHRSRSDADRSRLQENRPLLPRTTLSSARAAGLRAEPD